MKRILLSTLLVILFTGISFAQLQLAPVAGINLSSFRTTNDIDNEITHASIIGFMGGLNAKYSLTDHFNIQLEGTFSQKGTLYRQDYVPLKIKHSLNYFDISVLCEYALTKIISLNAGVNGGLQTSESLSEPDTDFGLGTGNNGIGLVGGLKFYIGDFFIRTNYLHGLTSLGGVVITNENGEQIGNSNAYNKTFQVALGYYLF